MDLNRFTECVSSLVDEYTDTNQNKELLFGRITELLQVALPSNLHINSLNGIINSLMFVVSSSGFREQDLLFQVTWIKSIVTFKPEKVSNVKLSGL
jgi:hypothetical protein